jgi:small conductance mechanosensitive channel
MDIFEKINWQEVQTLSITWMVKIIGTIIILLVGKWIARKIANIVSKSMEKAKTDSTLIGFTSKLVYLTAMVFVITAALSQLGIETASIITIVGAAGLAIGLALQGALSNFAAGILIIFFRPFKIDDLLEVAGVVGTVRVIELFTTTIITLDNKTVIIPNAQLTGDKIINFTETEDIRIDLVFGVGYNDNIDEVKNICLEVMKEDKRILSEPAPFTGMLEHGESSVNYAVRPWVKAANYWPVYFDLHEKVKRKFDEQGITIPFPQRDVHIISENKQEEK